MTTKSSLEITVSELLAELSQLDKLGKLGEAAEALRQLRVQTEKERQWVKIRELRDFVRGSRPGTSEALVEKAWEYLVRHDGTQTADAESGRYVYGGDQEVVPANCKMRRDDALYVIGQCDEPDRIYPLLPDDDVKALLTAWAPSL